MSRIEITKNPYQTTCDIYGCGNHGKNIIGNPDANIRDRILICDECLQNIINAATLEMIENRLKIENKVMSDKFIPEDSINGELTDEELKDKINNPEPTPEEQLKELIENRENDEEKLNDEQLKYSEMNFKDLREIAKEKGLTVPIGMSKPELVQLIEGAK